jgi:glycosyltransferase involved in cell wall biosynthesis
MLHKFNVRAQRLSRWLLFSRAITRRASAVLVNSHFLQREAERVYNVPVNKFRLIRTGLDLAFEQGRFDSAQPIALPGHCFTISVVARLDARKRIDRLFEAVQPLVSQGDNIRILIAGDGPEKGKLERLAAKLGIESAVRLLGTVANPYEVFRAADLFVLPSDNEAFPNAMLEAMFAGVAVVVFAGGNGAGEVIESGVDGFVVRDVDELRMLIKDLSRDPERARRVAACAKARLAEKGLTLDRHITSLDTVITSVLEGAN